MSCRYSGHVSIQELGRSNLNTDERKRLANVYEKINMYIFEFIKLDFANECFYLCFQYNDRIVRIRKCNIMPMVFKESNK